MAVVQLKVGNAMRMKQIVFAFRICNGNEANVVVFVSVFVCACVSNDDIVRVEHSLFYSFQVHSRDYALFFLCPLLYT